MLKAHNECGDCKSNIVCVIIQVKRCCPKPPTVETDCCKVRFTWEEPECDVDITEYKLSIQKGNYQYSNEKLPIECSRAGSFGCEVTFEALGKAPYYLKRHHKVFSRVEAKNEAGWCRSEVSADGVKVNAIPRALAKPIK